MEEASSSLAYTLTWVLRVRPLIALGRTRPPSSRKELMILGFISLLLSVFQTIISRICIPTHLAQQMTPCKSHAASEAGALVETASRRLLSSVAAAASHCSKVPIKSVEAPHQLHIFIFVLSVAHAIFFCGTTMYLGGARVG